MKSRIVKRKNFKQEIADNDSTKNISKEKDHVDIYPTGLKIRTDNSIYNEAPMEEIRKDVHMGRYKTSRIGRHEIGASYKEGEERVTVVSVREQPTKILIITPDNFSLSPNESQVIHVKFNKPYNEDQVEPAITIPSGLELISKFRFGTDRTFGTFTIKAKELGSYTINVECAGITVSTRVNVVEKPVQKDNTVYKDTKFDPNVSDLELIKNYILTNNILPVAGDVFVVKLEVDGHYISLSSYIYANGTWEAITGNVDASGVIFHKDILLAGNYDNVGNIIKGNVPSKVYNNKGKSLQDLIDDIFTQVIQPKIIQMPQITNFDMNISGLYEAGTKFNSVSYGAKAVFDPGNYEFGKQTEVSLRTISVNRICEPVELSANNIGTEIIGSDNINLTIGDMGGDKVVSSIRYDIHAHHSIGSIALDNTGNLSNPIVQIKEGDIVSKSNIVKCARKMFYGGISSGILDSNIIRGLTSDFFESSRKLVFTIPKGSKTVAIACDKRLRGVTSVINKTALSADYTNVFKPEVVKVEGANGYHAIDYNVWVYKSLLPFEYDTTFEVTLVK